MVQRALVSAFALVLLFPQFVAAQGAAPEPSNRIVVIIDGSGSYKKRIAEAVERVAKLLETMAQTKVHRWETSADRVVLISLDAMPTVLWQGTFAELKSLDRSAWTKRFQARTDYASCTDVGEAVQLAVKSLDGDSRYVGKYLWIFSDLIDEPPTTSVSKCRPPRLPSLPAEGFPWESLIDVSVSVFWVPANQALAWKRLVGEHGLEDSFRLYTDSESAAAEIAPPPRRTITMTEAEAATARQELSDSLASGGRWVLKLAVVALLGVSAFGAMLFLVARRATRARPTPPRIASPRPGGQAPRGQNSGRPMSVAPPLPRSSNGRTA